MPPYPNAPESIEAPLALRAPRAITVHGRTLSDDYGWLRDKDDPRVRAYLEAENAYTRAVMEDSNHVPEPLARELHEHFTDPELVELTFLIGYINMLNLFNNALDVRYNGEYGLLQCRQLRSTAASFRPRATDPADGGAPA